MALCRSFSRVLLLCGSYRACRTQLRPLVPALPYVTAAAVVALRSIDLPAPNVVFIIISSVIGRVVATRSLSSWAVNEAFVGGLPSLRSVWRCSLLSAVQCTVCVQYIEAFAREKRKLCRAKARTVLFLLFFC